ncbi:class A beta-lactamase [Streptomyces sp. NPDC046465]|uniref:class A beta-lactamase n=1 Tax=Streptomyces sp. NPDC046465 TaxID=3155810 RepID=UPI0033E88920
MSLERMSLEESELAERHRPRRRALLVAAALLPLAGCGTDDDKRPDTRPDRHPDTHPGRSHRPVRFEDLERKYGGRLGIYALATGTGATLTHRADDRFAFCSTFKALAVAAVLHHNPLSHLDKRVTYTADDVDSISPITKDHLATGMTIRQLCDAAVRHSDGTAGNLLMRDVGGPARLTAYLRGLGDDVSRMDHYEPELNGVPPKDRHDTTTPRAIAADYRALVLGDALPADKRALLKGWLLDNATEVGRQRVRAGLPKGWTAADKTGTGNWGRANDIAIAWPPDSAPSDSAPSDSAPLVIAVMSDRRGRDAEPSNELIARATERVVAELSA